MNMSKIMKIIKWLQNISNNLGTVHVMKRDSSGVYSKHIDASALGMHVLFWTIIGAIVLIAILSAIRIIASVIAIAFLSCILYEVFMKKSKSNNNY